MNTFWDPLTGHVTEEEKTLIQANGEKVRSEYEKLKQNPYKFRNLLILSITLGLAITALLAIIFDIDSPDPDRLEGFFEFSLAAILIPSSLVLYKVRTLQRDITNMIIASSFGWLYDPERNKDKWNSMTSIYPEIFKFGDHSQYLENQFWGRLEGDTKNNFWLSGFNYTIGSGKNSHTYHNLVYAFELPTITIADFSLAPQGIDTKIKSFFSSTILTTESNEFNRIFHINCVGDLRLEGADILQILSPDTQEHLIAASKKHNGLRILFRDNVVFIEFTDTLKLTHTNLLKNADLDPRDEAIVLQNIKSVYLLAKEILECFEHMEKINA